MPIAVPRSGAAATLFVRRWEQWFFTCWQSPLCQSAPRRISLRWRSADLVWSWERMALPSPSTVARQHLSHTMIYKCRASPFFPLPLSLATPPWQQFFFSFLFLYPHSTKRGPQHLTAGQKKSESALSPQPFLALWRTVNAGGSDRKGEGVTGKAERCSEPRGYTNTVNMSDLSINQAVTTRRPSNWIVLAALRECRPF